MTKPPHTSKKSHDVARAIKLIVIVVISVMAITRTWFARAQSLPTDPSPTCTVTPAVFASWFETGAVSLNGVVNPADSITFPNAGNCSFYQWTEQMFLWLTSPAPTRYGGGGRILDSPVFYDVSPPDASGKRTLIPNTPGRIPLLNTRAAQVGVHGLPVILDKRGRMFEVEQPRISRTGKQLILNSAGRSVEIESAIIARNGKPVLRDKAGKVIPSPRAILRPQLNKARTVQRVLINRIPIFLDPFGNVIDTEVGQAGGGDVLESQISSNGSLVYYRTSVNDVYAYFLTGTKNGGILPAPTQFPTTPANLNQIITFAAAHGKVFPDPDALAIEVKSSWVEAAGLPNLSSYITMQATIPTYTQSANQWTLLGQKTVQLALVGIHVVGSAAGHPEMIWGTFEHFGNTPNAAYSYNSTTGLRTVPQSTAGPWLFCASGSGGPFNQAHMSVQSGNIVATPGNTVSPSDTLRSKPFGASSAAPNPLVPSAAASNTEIIAINNSVIGQLVSGDIRRNYFMMGATWTIGGAAPNFPPPAFGPNFGSPGNLPGNAVGTSQLANTTMETYQQTPAFSATSNNCFNCHATNTTSVSHVFSSLQPLFP